MPLRAVGAQYHASRRRDGGRRADLRGARPARRGRGPRAPAPRARPAREPIVGPRGRPLLSRTRGAGVLRDVDLEHRARRDGRAGRRRAAAASRPSPRCCSASPTPTEGGVLCGGVDLREVDPRSGGDAIAWVPQRPTIFAASVADNVRLADPDADERRRRGGARARPARSSFVGAAPAGPRDARSATAGGGSRPARRNASRSRARSYATPHCVVLDEPTANLDGVAAEAVATATGAAGCRPDRAAHRPSDGARRRTRSARSSCETGASCDPINPGRRCDRSRCRPPPCASSRGRGDPAAMEAAGAGGRSRLGRRDLRRRRYSPRPATSSAARRSSPRSCS